MFGFYNYRGFSIVSFLSIVTASTVMGTCGWILLANESHSSSKAALNKTEFGDNSSCRNTTTINTSFCKDEFRERFLRFCAISVVVGVSQLISAVYLLISQPQECRMRGKVWLVLNLFLNLVYLELVVLLATGCSAINETGEMEDGSYSQCCVNKVTSATADYLPAFFIATVTCFAFHYSSLVLVLLLLRCLQGEYNGYSLISLVPSEE